LRRVEAVQGAGNLELKLVEGGVHLDRVHRGRITLHGLCV
jgi:hypothetical protein